MLGFGLFCLDLGHTALIWAIWQNLGQNRPQMRQSPEDGAGGDKQTNRQTDGWMDGWTDSPCVLQDCVHFGAPALLPLNLNQTLLKQGTDTADHLLSLGCYSFYGHQHFFFYAFIFIYKSQRPNSQIRGQTHKSFSIKTEIDFF